MKLNLLIVILLAAACSGKNEKTKNMKQASVIELVLWKPKSGVSTEEMKASITELNQIVNQMDGFISRETALSEDGQFVDIVYWTDLESAQKASELAIQNPSAQKVFSLIDEKEMLFKHFDIFNALETE